jgi:3-hydroxyisobutyrate dehydrogenase-like beta-hydroxyacid dehydrogenase
MKNIGFIGLGTMGKPMALNLLKKGYTVTVYNRTASKAEELISLGADMALSPAAVAADSDIIFTMVSNDEALLEVVYGADGITAGMRPGLTIIDSSTVAPTTSQRIYEDLIMQGIDFLDAPVTGSKPAAESASLVFMVGGHPEVFEENYDLLMDLGKLVLYMGPSGSGSSAKLAHNTMVGINLLSLAEGMSIAVKSGLNPEQFAQIVQAGSANSRQAELKSNKIIEHDFDVQFSLKLMLKDLVLASDLTGKFQLPTPLLHAATSVFQMGLSKGYGEDDLSAVVQCYEEWMGAKIAKPSNAAAAETTAHATADSDRRRAIRLHMGIDLQLSIYQWEQEGSFSGQNISGTLIDLSESGMMIQSRFPLAQDMFIVIHFPQEADLPPITARVIRIIAGDNDYKYGCMLSGLPPYVRIKLEAFIEERNIQALLQ